jgi:Cd2+/Zn2+-exporting ATPase
MDIRPDTATVLRDGVEQVVDPSTVEIGEIILIKAGEKVPMDGEVIEGSSLLDTVALTGESVPRGVTAGDNVISGCVNLIGLLKVRVSKSFGESTAAKILDLVQNASEAKSKKEKFIRRFSRIYTPVVVGLAALVAIVPPVLAGIGVGGYDGAWATWIYRALCFLIVSCPCAFVISIPLSFFGGIGAASKHGILVKGSNYLEALARTSTTVFDKTGTLTEGVFELTAVHPLMDEKGLLHLVSHVEHNSIHPIAAALRDAFPCDSSDCSVSEVKEHPGMGVSALVNGSSVAVGDASLMRHVGADISSECEECKREGIVGTMVHVAINGDYVGHILISDRIKEDSSSAIKALRDVGISKIVMLTGDNEEVAGAVSKELGIDEYHAGLLPADKLSIVEGMLSQKNSLAFVGEGINDAPVLARADVGIAMGALGSDAAIEAADVVIMDDKPSKIVSAIRIARKTVRIATQNTWFAIGIKVVVLVLAFFGIAHMWLAVFADVGVTILCIFNAMRALSIRKV